LIGKRYVNNSYFAGQLAELRIWNIPRTTAEIKANISRRLESIEPGLVGYWLLEKGSGEIAYDSSFSDSFGMIAGATWSKSKSPIAILSSKEKFSYAGDQIFAQSLDKGMKERFFRCVNNNDVVPRIPSLKFSHVGKQLYFDSDGNLCENMLLSWLNWAAWCDRLKGYYKTTVNLQFESDSVGDHRMGDYRRLAMRQLDNM
jgi:hypothetical protein